MADARIHSSRAGVAPPGEVGPGPSPPSPGRPDPLEAELAALHPASFGWALACCGRDRSAAEDVLQEAYFKILDGRARFRGHSTFKTWLFGVIRLTAREHSRWSILRLFRTSDPAGAPGSSAPTEIADSRPAPESEAVLRERAEQVARALARLPERQREVLHLVFYEDLSISEAAAVMGVSLGTARQHYERGKQSMLTILDDVRSRTERPPDRPLNEGESPR
jgi:RNA polymerase sigma factor (sigma-70 family)